MKLKEESESGREEAGGIESKGGRADQKLRKGEDGSGSADKTNNAKVES